MIYPIHAVIFAGGKSSRMKNDKSLLPFGAYPTLTQYQHVKLSRLFKEVYISAKADKFDFECQIIEDNNQESSPLIGIISIFESLKTEKVFILSVDAPFVDEKVIGKLFGDTLCCHAPTQLKTYIFKSLYG